MAQIDALIQAQPNNPYFHELKGQSLLEGARPADAIAPLRRAAALAPSATLIRIMLGQALVATGDARYSDEAISLLRVAQQPDAPEVYSSLPWRTAARATMPKPISPPRRRRWRGDTKTARELAARAKTRFPTGSPGWVKSDDIVGLKQQSSGGARTNFTFGPAEPGLSTHAIPDRTRPSPSQTSPRSPPDAPKDAQ